MDNLAFNSPNDILAALKNESNGGNVSLRGMAKLAGVSKTSIIESGRVRAQKLAQALEENGFEGGHLAKNGFPPQAVILVLEYFAFDSKAEAKQAKQLIRTFGTLGIMQVLNQLETPSPHPRSLPPCSDIAEYAETSKAIEEMRDNQLLKRLLQDTLVDRLELSRNQKALPGDTEKKKYTIVKVRAKQLGYTESQIGGGSALGRWVARFIESPFTEMVGRFPTKHYLITPELDDAIREYLNRG